MKNTMIVGLALLVAMAAAAGAGNRERTSSRCSLEQILLDMAAQNLRPREVADLLFMREEEKLARDVYLSSYESWDLKIFRKIATSEKNHMALVELLIDKYDLEDPVARNGLGVFTDEHLQRLYDELAEIGGLSVESALAVGALIEEIDIADLLAAIEAADNRDLQTLYQNLMRGSRNHLRAFNLQLERLGIDYEPVELSQEAFDDIVTTPAEGGVVDFEGSRICGRQRPRSR